MESLKVEHLSVAYKMRRLQKNILAINDLDFEVKAGEFVAIVGPSGCGKTTILNAIAGLLRPMSGRISFDGSVIRAPGRDRAMVFQTPALLPWRTVLSNVAYGLELQGQNHKKAQAKSRAYIELVGLEGFEESYPHELSGGMQQRVNLARALAVQPKLLLFDEPLSALDAQTREHMQAELQRIWLKERTTSLYVTHQISEAIFLADRVIVMTPSPGTVKEIVPVDLPRPRPLRLQRSEPFLELENQIWDLLEGVAGLSESGTQQKRDTHNG